MIVLVFVTLTDRAEAQVPEQYSAFTEPKAEAGGTRAQLSAPLPHLCPLPPHRHRPPVVFRYPISRAIWTGSAQAVQGSDLSRLRPFLGIYVASELENKVLGISELSLRPCFSAHGPLSAERHQHCLMFVQWSLREGPMGGAQRLSGGAGVHRAGCQQGGRAAGTPGCGLACPAGQV